MLQNLFLQQLFQRRFQKKRRIFIEAIVKALLGDVDLMALLGFHRKIIQTLLLQFIAVKNDEIEKHAAADLAIRTLGEPGFSGQTIKFFIMEKRLNGGVQIFCQFGEQLI